MGRRDAESETLIPQQTSTFAKTHKPMSDTDAEGWSPQDHSPTITYWPRDRSDVGTDVAVVQTMSVRRLTPTECERLQGFPDGWTQVAWKGKAASECPDGPRYKALGNSMAVNCMRWIGARIQAVEEA
jgi:DNA (cytosine-5)-methyltransferase 1